MAWEQERDWIAEKKARKVAYEDSELLFRRQLVRFWPKDIDALVESTLRYLYSYSTDNNTDPPTDQQFVVDPQADRLTYEGTWRVVSNEKTSRANEAQWPGIGGIVQTLRYGFAQSLVWDEARVINNRVHPGNASAVAGVANTTSDDPEDFLLVEWVNLDPNYTRAMVSGGILTGDTITSPTIRGVEYTGDWHKVAVINQESELLDGSGRIQVLLARPQYTLNAYTSYFDILSSQTRTEDVHYLWNVPKDLAQTIIDSYKGTGRSASAAYSADHLVNLVLGDVTYSGDHVYLTDGSAAGACSFTEVAYHYWGVEDPTKAAYQIQNQATWQATGWTWSKSVSLDKSEGRFDIVLTRRHTEIRHYNWLLTGESALLDSEIYNQFGLTGDAQMVAITPHLQGIMYDRNVRINADCTRDVTTTRTTSAEAKFYTSWWSKAGISVMYMYENARSFPAALVAALPATSDNNVSHTFKSDGTYDVTVISVPRPHSFVEHTDFYYTRFVPVANALDAAGEKELNYTQEGEMHLVEFFTTEKAAYERIFDGWNGVVSKRGDYWRTDMIVSLVRNPLAFKMNTPGLQAERIYVKAAPNVPPLILDSVFPDDD